MLIVKKLSTHLTLMLELFLIHQQCTHWQDFLGLLARCSFKRPPSLVHTTCPILNDPVSGIWRGGRYVIIVSFFVRLDVHCLSEFAGVPFCQAGVGYRSDVYLAISTAFATDAPPISTDTPLSWPSPPSTPNLHSTAFYSMGIAIQGSLPHYNTTLLLL